MNTALWYLVPFALAALGAWAAGHRARAVGLAWMAGGLAVFAPFVSFTPQPVWAAAGVLIWAAVAFALTKLAVRGKITPAVPSLGYAMAFIYHLHFVWPGHMREITTAANAVGLTMLLLMAGPAAYDLSRRMADLALRLRRRRDLARRVVDAAAAPQAAEGEAPQAMTS